ncbi:hypothetical protein ACS0TY_031236 [Phlomoides rotata]
MKEIADLGSRNQHSLEFHDVKVPTTEDALKVERTMRMNCLVWAKSDSLARDLIRLSVDTMVKDSDTNVLIPPPPNCGCISS